MKITRLKLENFLFHESLDLKLDKPVNLIVGPNECGKTTLPLALEFALFGTAGPITKKADRYLLAHNGADKFSVELQASDPAMTIRRSRTASSVPQREINKLAKPEILRACLNAFRFLEMSRTERRKLLGAFSELDPEVAEEALNEAGLAGDTLTEIRDIAVENLGRAETVAVERRRAAKRAANEQIEVAPSTVEVGDRTYDLVKMADQEHVLKNRIHELEGEEAKLLAARGGVVSRQAVEANLAEINGRLEELEPKLVLGSKATIETAEREITQWEEELTDKSHRLEQLRQLIAHAGKNCGICDLMSCALDPKAVEEARDTYTEAVADATEKLKKVREDVKELLAQDSLAQDAARLRQERNRLQKELEAAGEFKDEDALEAVQKKLGLNREIKAALRAWQHSRAARDRAETAKKNAESEIALWNRVAHVLGKDGALRKLMAGDIVPNMVSLAAGKSLFPMARKLKMDASGAVLLDGIPSELLSRSARFRLGVLTAHCFAHFAGLGFLVIDEADVLTPPNRKLLFEFLASIREQYGTILVLASEGERSPRASDKDWLDVWYLDNGLRRAE